MKMTDLNIAVLIINNELECFRASDVIKELKLVDIISNKKMKRILNDITNYHFGWLTTKLSNELSLLYFLNRYFVPSKFFSYYEIHRCAINFKISDRQFRRYIKDLNDSGYKTITKRGVEGGYRLEKKLSINI